MTLQRYDVYRTINEAVEQWQARFFARPNKRSECKFLSLLVVI